MRPASWGSQVTWTAAYVAAVLVGRATFDDEVQVALFWPAAGVAAVWILSVRSPRGVAACLTVVFVTNAATGVFTGFPAGQSALGAVGHVATAFLVRALYGALRRAPVLGPLRVTLHRPRDLTELVSVAAASGAVGGLVHGALQTPTVGLVWNAYVALSVRHAVSLVVVGAMLLVLLDPAYRATRHLLPRGWSLELLLLLASTAGVMALILSRGDELPLGFSASIVVAWAGYRFPPPFVVLYNVGLTSVIVVFTHLGFGPYGALTDPWGSAALVQLFAGVSSVVALMLSLGVAERRDFETALAELEAKEWVRRERNRLAREANDTIVQGLAAAEIALDLQRHEHARRIVGTTSTHARQWIGALFEGEEVRPGTATRRTPAGASTEEMA